MKHFVITFWSPHFDTWDKEYFSDLEEMRTAYWRNKEFYDQALFTEEREISKEEMG